MKDLKAFVRESNAIEGIIRQPYNGEVASTKRFLEVPIVTIDSLCQLVEGLTIDKPAKLRRAPGMDVRVGGHIPPPGGPGIVKQLQALLIKVNTREISAWEAHCSYETLHPFSDGNGRSGRALWAWKMLKQGEDPFALAFLHSFYYQTLRGQRHGK